MATIEQLINRIETEVSLAAGLDVQVHAEDALLAILRRYYNKFFEYAWWDDYLITETFTLDGTTGLITADISAKILSMRDIHSVFYDSDPKPLPRKQNNVNPSLIARRCISPTPDATKVFKVWPVDTTGDVHVTYRTKLTDAVWETPLVETEINMDDELLVTAVAYDYLTTEGSNDADAEKFKQATISRLSELTKGDLNGPISKTSQSVSYPTRWDQW